MQALVTHRAEDTTALFMRLCTVGDDVTSSAEGEWLARVADFAHLYSDRYAKIFSKGQVYDNQRNIQRPVLDFCNAFVTGMQPEHWRPVWQNMLSYANACGTVCLFKRLCCHNWTISGLPCKLQSSFD